MAHLGPRLPERAFRGPGNGYLHILPGEIITSLPLMAENTL
jgi:hypothetical protein